MVLAINCINEDKMLREYSISNQDNKSPTKWFKDEDLELSVWFNSNDQIRSFELSYDKLNVEHSIRWEEGKSIKHYQVDNGEQSPLFNSSPILVANGPIDKSRILDLFKTHAQTIEARIYLKVIEVLEKM